MPMPEKYINIYRSIRDHENVNLILTLSKLNLDTVKEMLSLIPENACVRVSNIQFDNWCYIIPINGKWYFYDQARFPKKECLEEWFWESSSENQDSVSEYIEFIKREYEGDIALESEVFTVEGTSEYHEFMNFWTISFDRKYMRHLEHEFNELIYPDEELGIRDDVEIDVYPSTKPSTVDLKKVLEIYQSTIPDLE